MRSIQLHRTVWLLLFCSVLLAGQTKSTIPSDTTVVTSVEGVTEYRLSNGLRVLLMPDTSKATVTVNVTYLVGSRFEGYGETGMAHLLEHLQFKGTPSHLNIPDELSQQLRDGSGEGLPRTECRLKQENAIL